MNTEAADVRGFLKKQEGRVFSTLKEVCEIPSPTFQEEVKMRYLSDRLKRLGLCDVKIDATGNAIGEMIGDPADRTFVLISAHGDTACESPAPVTDYRHSR